MPLRCCVCITRAHNLYNKGFNPYLYVMKRKIILLFAAGMLMLASCHKSTCPTYDSSGDGGTKGGSKTKSGVYPKKMGK